MPKDKKINMAKPMLGRAEESAVRKVIRGGNLAQGPKVLEFETQFSAKIGIQAAVALNSGTSALHLMMLSLGIGPGDEVLVPSFSFAATANSVALTGATPVFADINEFYNLDPRDVESKITKKTKAIMPVHLYGQAADMASLEAIATMNNLILLEDAAQAHLAEFDGKKVGSWGKAAAFSFYPTKNMTSGEGGMVTTADADLARMIKIYRNQGMERRYENEVVGFNNRMTDIHAAIGIEQLRRLEKFTQKRQENAVFFDANLKNVETPKIAPKATHVYHQYTIWVEPKKRTKFQEWLAGKGVSSDIYYPTPIHQLPSFGMDLKLPNTEKAAAGCLSLPVHPGLSTKDLHRIVDAVNSFKG